MKFYAHKKFDSSGKLCCQTAESHCRCTAEYASECLKGVSLNKTAYLAGLLHDAGKFKLEFQNYLLKDEGQRGSINHSFAGSRMAIEHFHNSFSGAFAGVSCELIAFAIAAHHGLFDCVNEKHKSGFDHIMNMENINYSESRDNFLKYCAGWDELEALFAASNSELEKIYAVLYQISAVDPDLTGTEFMFYISLLERLILSSVIEGDRRDTAQFMCDIEYPPYIFDYSKFWTKYLNKLEKKLVDFESASHIQNARKEISDICRKFAENPPGVYKLNAPTGAGKTLSSLRFALAHAAKWHKKRIIFVTPLLAILEQNAAVIHDFIGDDSIILEHHSNVLDSGSSGEDLDKRELAMDNWNSPIIITTLVQLLNTFFLGKSGCIRRFQALCNSIVIIDEVQTVPNNMLSLFNLTVNFLSKVCGTTFLLCSATQPCFDKAVHPLIFSQPSELVPYSDKLWAPFKRTKIQASGAMKLEDIPFFITDKLSECESLLVICNKKSQAEYLYDKMRNTVENCFHLSASMCISHRQDTVLKIQEALKHKKSKVLCISTQLIEAGVDISFQNVIRFTAGMDSVVQAAGRCNRNAEQPGEAPVHILQCADEKLGKLKDIKLGQKCTLALIEYFKANPAAYDYNLGSEKAISKYYEKLYHEIYISGRNYQDFAVEGAAESILELLSGNTGFYDSSSSFYGKYTLNQAFKIAGRLFRVFDDNTIDVVVPYGKGKDLIDQLIAKHDPDPGWLMQWSRQVRPYTVSLYEYQLEKFGDLICSVNGILILRNEAYDENTGLGLKNKFTFWEV